jgi:hypothetical protein
VELGEMLRRAVAVPSRPTDTFLDQTRADAPADGSGDVFDENAHTRNSLMDATRAVVERARTVLHSVTQTLAQTHSDDAAPRPDDEKK